MIYFNSKDREVLEQVLSMTQEELHEGLFSFLVEAGYQNIQESGYFLHAKGNIPVMLIAHLDTVFETPPKELFYNKKGNVITSPFGLGGDDRCGVFAIMKLINRGFRPHVLFCHDEETTAEGAISASNLVETTGINFLIELDRKGKDDAVFYDCGNEAFRKMIIDSGFKLAYGTFSDICVLSPVWDIASVNLSIGYFNEHTLKESINTDCMYKTINSLAELLSSEKVNTYYNFQEIVYSETYKSDEDGLLYWEEYLKEKYGYYGGYEEEDFGYNEAAFYPDVLEEEEEEDYLLSKEYEAEMDACHSIRDIKQRVLAIIDSLKKTP